MKIAKANLNFEDALSFMRHGHRVRRPRWGSDITMSMDPPTFTFQNAHSRALMLNVPDYQQQWLCCQDDILADDWQLIADD